MIAEDQLLALARLMPSTPPPQPVEDDDGRRKRRAQLAHSVQIARAAAWTLQQIEAGYDPQIAAADALARSTNPVLRERWSRHDHLRPGSPHTDFYHVILPHIQAIRPLHPCPSKDVWRAAFVRAQEENEGPAWIANRLFGQSCPPDLAARIEAACSQLGWTPDSRWLTHYQRKAAKDERQYRGGTQDTRPTLRPRRPTQRHRRGADSA